MDYIAEFRKAKYVGIVRSGHSGWEHEIFTYHIKDAKNDQDALSKAKDIERPNQELIGVYAISHIVDLKTSTI